MTKSSGKTGSTPEASTGSLVEMVQPDRAVGFVESFGRDALIKIAVLGVLVAALHFKLLDVMVRKWVSDSNWTHGFIIPLFSLYLLYMRREELFEARRKICIWGLALVLLAMAAEVVAVLRIRNHWLAQMSMVVMLFGLVLYLGGWSVIRVTWLPILFLLFALPIPELLYSRVAVPLQNIAAAGAVVILKVLGVEITSTASALDIISRSGVAHGLTVAEACSGMRLLMAFCALGVAMAYLDYKPIWQRIILVAAAVPIAVFCNVIRVAITCWMYYIDQPEMGQGFMHTFAGILMLLPAFALLWALSWILQHIVVEEPAETGTRDLGLGTRKAISNQQSAVSSQKKSKIKNPHFVVAAGMLLLASVAWNTVLAGKYFAKKPVPPPPHAKFEEHRLTNFPARIGPYVLVGDGDPLGAGLSESEGKKPDGLPDGITVLRAEDLDTLGTLKDDWNWYYMAVYRDTRVAPGGNGYRIRLDITYYTGLLEAVPHVGERCIVAGGGTIIYDQSKPIPVRFPVLPAAWKNWKDIEAYRTTYEVFNRDGTVARASQYHFFSMNGKPEWDWMKVRWDMGALSLKYCYFAKVQIAAQMPEPDVEKSDAVCREFLEYVLPEVLQFFASADDVKKMEK